MLKIGAAKGWKGITTDAEEKFQMQTSDSPAGILRVLIGQNSGFVCMIQELFRMAYAQATTGKESYETDFTLRFWFDENVIKQQQITVYIKKV